MNTPGKTAAELRAMAEALEWAKAEFWTVELVTHTLRTIDDRAAELRAAVETAEKAQGEPVAPTAYIERITGRLAAPYDDHRCRFPMVYDALYIHPDPRVAELEKALRYCIKQAEHDMLLTGDEIRMCRAALGEGKS